MAAMLRADQMHVVFFEHAAVGEFDGEVERGLSADGGQNGKSRAGRHLALDADDLFEIFARERLDVSAVGRLGIGHDGGRIRVGQHHFKALGLERLAGLRAGVVELGRLADDDGAGAEDQDFRDVSSFWHLCRCLEPVVRGSGQLTVSGCGLRYRASQGDLSRAMFIFNTFIFLFRIVIPSEARDLQFCPLAPAFSQVLPGRVHGLDQRESLCRASML